MPAKFKLGDRVRDKYTGYEGRVHAIALYITGCNQVLINTEKLDKDGVPVNGEWFDEVRVELVKAEKPLKKLTTGGPLPAEFSALRR